MDKLKPYLTILAKHQFWIYCVVILATSLGCWWWSTKNLTEQFAARERAIKTDFSSVASVTREPPFPAEVVKAVKDQQDELTKGVQKTWEMLYDEEKEKNPFPDLGDGGAFEKEFKKLTPKKQLDSKYRETYQTFIKDHLPKLKKIIQAREQDKQSKPANPVGQMTGGSATSGGSDTQWTGVVDWDAGDYERLTSRFDWPDTPSTLAVVLAQEDLWVYEALLRVIAETNKPAKTQANAAVKRIISLDIGHDAVVAWKEAEGAVFSVKQGTPGSPTDPIPGSTNASNPGRSSGPGATDSQLVSNRYVDDKGQPLASTEAEYPYVKHPFLEFKMMPVRMSLIMDGRSLPKLLVNCANSNMPIEVRRVRILKSPSSPIDLGQLAGSGTGPGGRPSGNQGGAPAPTGAKGSDTETGPYDIPVDILAVIYIYCPPDREKLGTGAAAGQTPAEPPPPIVAPKPTPTPGPKPKK
jgi:hypothetical protein